MVPIAVAQFRNSNRIEVGVADTLKHLREAENGHVYRRRMHSGGLHDNHS